MAEIGQSKLIDKAKMTIGVPDPINLGEFIYFEHEIENNKTICQWCGTTYRPEIEEKSNCTNCGGPIEQS